MIISSCLARWDAVLRFGSLHVVGERGSTVVFPLLLLAACRGRTGVMGSGRLREFGLAGLGERLSGRGMEGPVVLSFMDRRWVKD
jgi:hypothetical protein